jgi:tripartite-type tricarboxylate transporter receptor subunit TctC
MGESMRPRNFALGCCLLAAVASQAHAQNFPARPIRVVVPVPPGGIIDVVGRLLCQKITEQTGQTAIVDNRTGGLTNVGSEIVARSPGDGYTLLLQSLPMVINPAMLGKMPYDYAKDLAPISLVVTSPYLLVVHPSVPAKSIKELIAVAKARPGSITYSSSGNASNLHVAVELFASLAGVKMLHIPYKGGGPALTAVLGGEADLSALAVSAVMSHVNAGRMRALAITSPARRPALPQIPAVAETVAGFDFASWVGVLAPASTPAALVATINGIVVKAVRAPDLVERFTNDATDVVANSPTEFRAFMQSEAMRWAKVVKDSGMRAD